MEVAENLNFITSLLKFSSSASTKLVLERLKNSLLAQCEFVSERKREITGGAVFLTVFGKNENVFYAFPHL